MLDDEDGVLFVKKLRIYFGSFEIVEKECLVVGLFNDDKEKEDEEESEEISVLVVVLVGIRVGNINISDGK